MNPLSLITGKIGGASLGVNVALIGALVFSVSTCTKERAGRKADRVAYATAQEDAKARQIIANIATEAASRERARIDDAEHQNALADAQRASQRYLAGNRMRVQAACRPASGTSAPAEGDPASVPESPATGPELVAITRDDFDAATDAYAYAMSAHRHATGMVEAGEAVFDEVPGVGFMGED